MIEQAFRVKPGTDFHSEYFAAREEKVKFAKLAHDFFQKNGFADGGGFYILDRMYTTLTEQEKEKFYGQYVSSPDKNGLYAFKKRSKLQKRWEVEVVAPVNMELIQNIKFWWLPYVSHGSYALWDFEGVIYGHLMDRSADKIQLAKYMEPIKLSEYYMVYEAAEAAEKAKGE